MRLIHTSDWHLGRSLHAEPLLGAQRHFLQWLLRTSLARRADAVLVAGDIYDRAVPPVEAVRLLDETLADFAAAGVPILLTSGNHDSAVRLGFAAALSETAGVHLRTAPSELARPVVLADEHGPVALYGIPYLLPDAVMESLGVVDRSHAAVLSAATAAIRADASARGIDRVVVAAHAFVTGAAVSESERDIRVGGIGDAPASVFAGFTYAALGHLHGAQTVGPSARVRYCGSPLAFSFSERHHRKSVTQVDIAANGSIETELIATPVLRALREVRGRLEELLSRAGDDLGDLGDLADAFVKVTLTDPVRPAAPMERLRAVWPHTLLLEFAPAGAPTDADAHAAADLARLAATVDPVEICASFVEWVDGAPADAAARRVLRGAVEAAQQVEVGA
ncbi:MAG: exonuclease SbcCD subunit D [Actinomycetota bacterium]|nr:exonuclease SbcCD subunit D [Actinomycetota bacterium]